MRAVGFSALIFGLLCHAAEAAAFTHLVRSDETLASIASKYYGKVQFERLLVAANLLDVGSGSAIVPGMRLEIPAVAHRAVMRGDTWQSLASELLGAPHRKDVLARANGAVSSSTPEVGAELVVPYNLRVVVGPSDSLASIAQRFLGDPGRAWMLEHYNALHGLRLEVGRAVLVPLSDARLTDVGKRAARASAEGVCSEAQGAARDFQQRASEELSALRAEVEAGKYVIALQRGTRLLDAGNLTEVQAAETHRQLLEAYAALDAEDLAAAACADWRARDPQAKLDPVAMSPKLLAACEKRPR